MITVEEALKHIESLKVEKISAMVPLNKALGFTLAEDLYSTIDIPGFDQSAMDGYAVCGKHPSYKVIDEARAGETKEIKLNDGEACRIFTGAKVPISATCVIMQEKTSEHDHVVHIEDEIINGKNIRPTGEQIKKGGIVYTVGKLLDPGTIGMIQSLGLTDIKVYQKPVITLLVTGDELVQPGEELESGQVYESNSITIKTAIEDKSFQLHQLTFVKDNAQDTNREIRQALNESDVVLISGGISVGDYDFVQPALKENNVEQIFYKISQKPGKPLYFGRKGSKYIFGLPGNPAAALTCFYIYVLPLLDKLVGKANIGLKKLTLPILHDYQKKPGKSVFLKALVNENGVSILDKQASSMLMSFGMANALVYLSAEITHLSKGDNATVYLL